MYNGSGEIIGICVICRDVTDLNKMQDRPKLEPQEYRSEVMRSVFELGDVRSVRKKCDPALGREWSR